MKFFMILLSDLWYFYDTSCKITQNVSFFYLIIYQLFISTFCQTMILWYFFHKKLHLSITKSSWGIMHKSKAADLQGVPKNRLTFGHSMHTAWAINAHRLFYWCPSLVQSMPSACSLSAHLTGKTDHLMVSYRTAYVILFLIQLVNLSSYS